jgi:hypothetical protein
MLLLTMIQTSVIDGVGLRDQAVHLIDVLYLVLYFMTTTHLCVGALVDVVVYRFTERPVGMRKHLQIEISRQPPMAINILSCGDVGTWRLRSVVPYCLSYGRNRGWDQFTPEMSEG